MQYELNQETGVLSLIATNQQEALVISQLAQAAGQNGYKAQLNAGNQVQAIFQLAGKPQANQDTSSPTLVDCPEHGEAQPAVAIHTTAGKPFDVRCAECFKTHLLDDLPDVTIHGQVQP